MAVAPSKPHTGHGRNTSGKVVRAERGQQVSLELPNAALDLDRLFGQGGDHLRGEIRDLVRFTGHRAPDECQGVGDALGMAMPNSARSPRSMLTSWVRWRTRRSRVRCSANAACCSTDLIGTKRMVGRVTASQIASASPASVLPRFT